MKSVDKQKVIAENKKDIAIVGMSCRFPDANDFRQYWSNLAQGVDSIQDIGDQRWSLDEFFSLDYNEKNKSYTKWGGLIDNLKEFDAPFFNIGTKEAESMDPQQRVLLEEVHHCIEDSGISLSELQKAITSVYVGVINQGYDAYAMLPETEITSYASSGICDCILANRVSYFYGLRGNSIVINTGCSASLVALHQAKMALQNGECDYAIVAGVNINILPIKYISGSKARMLSPTGKCKTFDKDADGYVPGEGVGVVILQRMKEAKDKTNNIYGIIKGSSVNHVGTTNSLTAPSVASQMELILDAYKDAGIDPSMTNYVEAHGTGTSLGDPIELEALTKAFQQYTEKKQYCYVGSVKANIGHLEPASGIASLIKVMMMMKQHQIPPQINFNTLNPVIVLKNSPFMITKDLIPWEKCDETTPLTAGISSFGFGGSNAHVLVQEYVSTTKKSRDKKQGYPFLLSAKSQKGLLDLVDEWNKFMKTEEFNQLKFSDVCLSLLCGRSVYNHRLLKFVKSADDIKECLKDISDITTSAQKGKFILYINDLSDIYSDKIDGIVRENKFISQIYKKNTEDAKKYLLEKNIKIGEEEELRLKKFCIQYSFCESLLILGVTPDFITADDNSVPVALCVCKSIQFGQAIDMVYKGEHGLISGIAHPHIPYLHLGSKKILKPYHITDNFLSQISSYQIPDSIMELYVNRANEMIGKQYTFTKALLEWNNSAISYDLDINKLLRVNIQDFSDQEKLVLFVAIASSIVKINRKWNLKDESLKIDNIILDLLNMIVNNVLSPKTFLGFILGEVNNYEEIKSEIQERLTGFSEDYEYLNSICADEDEITDLQRSEKQNDILAENKYDVICFEEQHMMGDNSIKVCDFDSFPQMLGRLCELGVNVDWSAVYQGEKYQKVSLVNYPFDHGKSYWIGKERLSKNFHKLQEYKEEVETDEQKISLYSNDTFGLVCEYFNGILCELLKRDEAIELDEEFREMGIDSIAINDFNSIMNQEFGDISQMIMFECVNLRELAMCFINKYGQCVEQIVRGREVVSETKIVDDNYATLSTKPELILPENEEDTCKDIAIIGLSGEFAGCEDVDELWLRLIQSEDLIKEIPIERWDYKKIFSENSKDAKKDKIYCKYGSFLKDIDKFDPLFFKLSPNESEKMDPQERRFLQTAWHTFEDAGYGDLKKMDRTKIGVFVGMTTSLYALIGEHERMKGNLIYPTSRPWSVSNRVSYVLDLHGPSITVDAACASSLTSFHLACESILNNECSMAIAGGVNMHLHNSRYIELCQFNMLSPTGRCHSFSEEADGFVPGEGCAAVLLKPLNKAIEDNDNIYAVVKASAINHSGLTSGYAVPSAELQADVIDMAIRKAGISARTINAIEAHGTGTKLGDPLEIKGLLNVFQRYTTDKNFCSIGSIKSNIGHCEGAAGIASVIKAILELTHKKRLPIYGLNQINRNIDFSDTPFYPQAKLADWENLTITDQDGELKTIPRRIEVSCFGAGGVNVATILEEFNETIEESSIIDIENIFICSAKTENGLIEYAQKLLKFIKEKRSVDFERFVYTLQIGREAMNYRLAIQANDYTELINKLEEFLNNRKSNILSNIYFEKVSKANLKKTLENIKDADGYVEKMHEQRNTREIIRLWINGYNVNWGHLYSNTNICKASLPTYPFERTRYWVPITDDKPDFTVSPCVVNKSYSSEKVMAENCQIQEASYETIDGDRLKSLFVEEVRNIIANIAGIEPEKIELESEFTDYGFDSLTLKDLTDELVNRFHFEVSPTVFFSYNDFGRFTDYLFAEYQEIISKAFQNEKSQGNTRASEIEDTMQFIEEIVLKCISEISKIPRDRIDQESDMSDYGFDSISLGELTNDLNEALGIDLLPTIFFSYDSISAFVQYLKENYGNKITKQTTDLPICYQEQASSKISLELPTEQEGLFEKIAIIGISVKLPNADDLEEYWDNLINNRSSISEVPKERWNWEDYYSEDKNLKNKTISKWGGFIKDAFSFDAKFFNISPYEAEYMDPQQRKLLETVWHAVENSGYNMNELSGRRVGVFISTENCDYRELLTQCDEIDAQFATGSSNNMLANRISYLFDFHGPSEMLDTACSGSLSAINRAIDAIHLKECECAIAGGVRLMLSPNGIVVVSKMGILAPDGKCKTFDKSANGYVKGEGVGSVVLKPLSKAISDGDHIYGVIAGKAVNHGGKSRSVTAPNAIAQSTLISDAIENAKLDPRLITYVETHGTGTELGDPIEIEGLTKAFQREAGERYLPNNYCGIGSLKTNIGHLENMSGIASIAKVLMSMKHKMIPATINFKELNPLIKFEGTPFYLVDQNRPWKKCVENGVEMPYYAGVSSFGFGGSNVHIILESFENNVNQDYDGEKLFVLSAKDKNRLNEYVVEVMDYIDQHRVMPNATDVYSKPQTKKTPLSPYDCIKEEVLGLLYRFLGNSSEEIKENITLGYMGIDEGLIDIFIDSLSNFYDVLIPQNSISENSTVDSIVSYIIESFSDKVSNHLKEIGDINIPVQTVNDSLNEISYDFNFSSFIYTYQVGRVAFNERLAIVANNATELYNSLSQYISTGVSNGKTIFTGSVKKQNTKMVNMASLFMENTLQNIASLWCDGTDIEWSQLYVNKKCNKIPVPGYPFAKNSYRVNVSWKKRDNVEERTRNTYSLIDTNMSTLKRQLYCKKFQYDDSIVSQHIVNGSKILPGAAQLEMARLALESATESRIDGLENIYWLSPICVDTECETYVEISSNNSDVGYEIYSYCGDEKRIHSKGGIIQQAYSDPMDVVKILVDCGNEMDVEQIYNEFERLNVDYGQEFRTIKEAFVSDDLTCGYTKLMLNREGFSSKGEYILNPMLLDGIFQSTAILISDHKKVAYVPFALKSIRILGPIPETCMVFVKLQKDFNKESCIFNITVTDNDLNEIIVINDFSSRTTR